MKRKAHKYKDKATISCTTFMQGIIQHHVYHLFGRLSVSFIYICMEQQHDAAQTLTTRLTQNPFFFLKLSFSFFCGRRFNVVMQRDGKEKGKEKGRREAG